MEVTKEIIKKIEKKVEEGSTYKAELKKAGIGLAKWYRAIRKFGPELDFKPGRKHRVYTPEKVKIVKERAMKGEYIYKICEDLGMDHKNFCRYCRQNGVKILTNELLKKLRNKRLQFQANLALSAKKTTSRKPVKAKAKKLDKKVMKKPVAKVVKKAVKKKSK